MGRFSTFLLGGAVGLTVALMITNRRHSQPADEAVESVNTDSEIPASDKMVGEAVLKNFKAAISQERVNDTVQ